MSIFLTPDVPIQILPNLFPPKFGTWFGHKCYTYMFYGYFCVKNSLVCLNLLFNILELPKNWSIICKIWCYFLNLPIELKPSLVPPVPRYLSFCNPVCQKTLSTRCIPSYEWCCRTIEWIYKTQQPKNKVGKVLWDTL